MLVALLCIILSTNTSFIFVGSIFFGGTPYIGVTWEILCKMFRLLTLMGGELDPHPFAPLPMAATGFNDECVCIKGASRFMELIT